MNTGFDLHAIQQMLRRIFSAGNNKLPVWMIHNWLSLRASTMLVTIEKQDIDLARIQLIQTFGWLCGIANHQHVDLSLKINLRAHFPGICPACGEAICDCKNSRLSERLGEDILGRYADRLPVDTDLQLMLLNIFPDNTLPSSVDHLVAEIGELGQETNLVYIDNAIRSNFRRAGYRLELADVMAYVFAVASLLDINLIRETFLYFEKGCSGCKQMECTCVHSMIELKKVGTRSVTARTTDSDSFALTST